MNKFTCTLIMLLAVAVVMANGRAVENYAASDAVDDYDDAAEVSDMDIADVDVPDAASTGEEDDLSKEDEQQAPPMDFASFKKHWLLGWGSPMDGYFLSFKNSRLYKMFG